MFSITSGGRGTRTKCIFRLYICTNEISSVIAFYRLYWCPKVDASSLLVSFSHSFVSQLLLRPRIEAPYRLEWKINRPLTLRHVSPEPPPDRKAAKKKSPKPKKKGKKGSASPQEEATHDAATQLRPPGYLPLRLAAPLPLMYQLYTGEEYDEEAMNKKKKGKKK